jgi:hypothetical protein
MCAWSSLWADRIAGERQPARNSLVSGTDVRRIESATAAAAYCAQYMAKEQSGTAEGDGPTVRDITGRMWGLCGDRSLLVEQSLCRLQAVDDGAVSADLEEFLLAPRAVGPNGEVWDPPACFWAFLPKVDPWPLIEWCLHRFRDHPRAPPRWRLVSRLAGHTISEVLG